MPPEAVPQPAKTIATPARVRRDPVELISDPDYLLRSAGVQRSTVELNRMQVLDVVYEGLGVNHMFDVTKYSAGLIVQSTPGDTALFNIKKMPDFDFSEYAGDDALDAQCGAFIPTAGDFAVQYRLFVRVTHGDYCEVRFAYDGQNLTSTATKASLDTRWSVSTQLYPQDVVHRLGVPWGVIDVDAHADGHVTSVRINSENSDLAGAATAAGRGSLYMTGAEYRCIIKPGVALAIFDLEIIARASAKLMIFLTRIV